jgi:hypothetical protein
MAQTHASNHPSRELSLVVTNLEQALLWFNHKEKP